MPVFFLLILSIEFLNYIYFFLIEQHQNLWKLFFFTLEKINYRTKDICQSILCACALKSSISNMNHTQMHIGT